ncbi:hypothetical protein GTA08_BOTSDO13237 [Neofusicoccum parvum]|nr:hypothetical protein GTA08_BOTSDO13237 [Neofusicoccum parvum]
MRLSSSFVAPSLLGLASTVAAGAQPARVYVQDLDAPAHLTQTAPTLSPDTARLVFAQRLGLAQYHSLKHADDDTIQYINDFGGSRHQLFDDEQLADDTKHIMVVVEGMKDTAVLDSASLSQFSLSDIPGSDATSRLLEDFTLQSEHLSSASRSNSKNGVPKKVAEILNKVSENVETRTSNGLLLAHIINSENQDLTSTIRELADLCSSNWPFTLAVMPPSSILSKRSSNVWGKYEVPKRSAERKRPEAFLAEAPASDFVQRVNKTKAPTSSANSNSTLVRGILPACFPSEDACESRTSGCSGRGSCVKKYTDKDNNNKACFTCKCKPVVKTNKDGSKKTTYYGGPACQKKDVVMPFWLFAGFAVFMAFLLSYGIGLLYSMGNEELPSVIGAGVSGPSARH